VEAGATGHRLVAGMHQAIAALSRAGNHVVADHVLVEPAWVAECAVLFADLPAYLVGVHCPLPVLLQREQDRRDRTPGQAAAQYGRVHAHTVYDLEVDTAAHSAQACAQQILDYLRQGPPPWAFLQLRQGLSHPPGTSSPIAEARGPGLTHLD
jgi:chloramphenicol 3-O phosphotransferase